MKSIYLIAGLTCLITAKSQATFAQVSAPPEILRENFSERSKLWLENEKCALGCRI